MARKNKITLSDKWKDGIQATMIMNRLCKHIEGELELTSTQIKAAQIVLSKVIPDLARTTIEGDKDSPLTVTINYPNANKPSV